MSLGGGQQKSSGESGVWDAQSPFLQQLFDSASNYFNNGQSGDISAAQDAARSGADRMGGLNRNTIDPWKQQLQGGVIDNLGLGNFYQNMMAGKGKAMETLTGLQNPEGNPYLQQMGQYGLDMQNQNYENAILPSVNTNAAFTGGLGGSRQGIAQGLAADSQNRESSNYLSNFIGGQYQADQNRAAQAASLMGGLQGASAEGFGNMLGQQDANSMNALGLSGQMLQNQMAPSQGYLGASNAGWSPYQQYGGVIGSPTVLNESKSSGWNVNGGLW